jgi:hypothetical protein
MMEACLVDSALQIPATACLFTTATFAADLDIEKLQTLLYMYNYDKKYI